MTSCLCAGCKHSNHTGHRVHGFPKDFAIRRQWVQFVQVRRPQFSATSITANSKICSSHFKEEDYDQTDARMVSFGLKSQKMARLIPNAVPSVHTPLCTCGGFGETLSGICTCSGEQDEESEEPDDEVGVSPTEGRQFTSLYELVTRLRWMMESSPKGTLDAKRAAKLLKVNPRRIADATNVLVGSGVIVQTAKHTFQRISTKLKLQLDREVRVLEDQEKKLDELIKTSLEQIYHMCEEDETSEKYLYLTYGDLKTIPSLTQKTVIVVKAPVESVLEMPHPAEGHQLFLRSTQGPIKVFLCSEDHSPSHVPDDPYGDEELTDHSSDDDGMTPPPSFPRVPPPGRGHDSYGRIPVAPESSPPLANWSVSPSPSPPFSSRVPPSPGGGEEEEEDDEEEEEQEQQQRSFAPLTTPLGLSLGGEGYLLGVGEDEGLVDPFSDELEGGLWRCLAPDDPPP